MKRNALAIKVPGFPAFTMAGEPCTREQALLAARLIWPAAEVVS